jgi:hypothetical protein
MELQENGLVLARMSYNHGPAPDDLTPDYFVLGESALQQEKLVLKFLSFWKDPAKQLWCSALIGDWMRTHELAVATGDEKLIRVAAQRAEQCRQDRVRRLIKSIGDRRAPFYALRGLYDLQAPELDKYVQRGLRGSSSPGAVTKFLNFTGDPRWCQQVFDLWSRGFRAKLTPQDRMLSYALQHDRHNVLEALGGGSLTKRNSG